MNNLTNVANTIPAMSTSNVEKVLALEVFTKQLPQVDIPTQHIIHGGMYARTIMIPPGVLLTGVLIKLATLVIINGDVLVYVGDQSKRMTGYNIFAASAHRKQAFVTETETVVTMIFPTHSKSVQEAEAEFTDDQESLMSHKQEDQNTTIITGE